MPCGAPRRSASSLRRPRAAAGPRGRRARSRAARFRRVLPRDRARRPRGPAAARGRLSDDAERRGAPHGISRTDAREPRERRTDHLPHDGGAGRTARSWPSILELFLRAAASASAHGTSTRTRRSASRSSRARCASRWGAGGPRRVRARPSSSRRWPGHDFANAGDGYALVRVEVRPALQMELSLRDRRSALADRGTHDARWRPEAAGPRALRPLSRATRSVRAGRAVVAAAPRRSRRWPGSQTVVEEPVPACARREPAPTGPWTMPPASWQAPTGM